MSAKSDPIRMHAHDYHEDNGELFERCSRLPNATVSGLQGKASCPVPTHGQGKGDRNRSFTFKLEGDKLLLHCFTGCSFEDMIEALRGPQIKQARRSSNRREPTYVFHYSEDGADVGIKVRYEFKVEKDGQQEDDKDFEWYTPRGYEAGSPGLNGRKQYEMPFFGHDNVLRNPGQDVLFNEGEKKVLVLQEYAYVAVSAPGGSTQRKFGNSLNVLAGRSVILMPDNDEAGRAFMHAVAAALDGIAAEVRWLQFAGVPEKYDVVDFFNDGHSSNELDILLASAPLYADAFPNRSDQPSSTTTSSPVEFTASELLDLSLPVPKWAVPQIVPEGLSLLGGKPKMGKSWLALAMGVACATGGRVLGEIEVEGGDVLYLSLEDNARRLQDRLKKLLGRDMRRGTLGRLHIKTEFPRLDNGGQAALDTWLKEHPACRLVIIDTWARVKPRRRGNGNAYEDDYAEMAVLHALARERGVAILVITHLRKASADDPLETLNATMGLTGAADAVLVLLRERGRHDASLYVRGRDVEEKELALKWDHETVTWSILGDAEAYRRGKERQEVIDVITGEGKALTPKEVSIALGKNPSATGKLMWQMGKDGDLTVDGGRYSVTPGNSGNAGNAGKPGN